MSESVETKPEKKPKKPRDREKYNEYMKLKMREYRAKKKAGFVGIPYG